MNASIPRFLCAVAMIAVILPTLADANAPGGRYVVTNGGTSSGTVYDTKTKLTWQQTISSISYTWADAKTYCAGVGSSLGGTGWRLPTLKELQSLVDYSHTTYPMIDSTAFPGGLSAFFPSPFYFWSASPLAGSSSGAWYVLFDYGYTGGAEVSFSYYVRCVR
jgi:hypothetical protein